MRPVLITIQGRCMQITTALFSLCVSSSLLLPPWSFFYIFSSPSLPNPSHSSIFLPLPFFPSGSVFYILPLSPSHLLLYISSSPSLPILAILQYIFVSLSSHLVISFIFLPLFNFSHLVILLYFSPFLSFHPHGHSSTFLPLTLFLP